VKLDHVYQGGCRYRDDARVGLHRLVVALTCRIGGLMNPHDALLDTGSHWCVLPPATAEELGCEPLDEDPPVRLLTRFGGYDGWLDRIALEIPAAIGEPISIQATWFVSHDWPGPLVLGWKGCLERLRWAIDPEEQAFYFGRL
jgi:hypothetical protein